MTAFEAVPAPDSRQDVHVHTTFSDDATSSPAACVTAAADAGLRHVCLTDHVRRDTAWVPALVGTIDQVRAPRDLTVYTGVEAKVWDSSGRLDLPDELPHLDRILVADHRFPAPGGPCDPAAIAHDLWAGRVMADEVIALLMSATGSALATAAARCERPVIAHLFSILPKLGLSEDDVNPLLVDELAAQAARTGAILDVNEKWSCPSPGVVARFLAAGAEVAPGSDAHTAREVGVHPGAELTIACARELVALAGPVT
ncbi:MAG: PHP domain-containing protein [Frankia sp.]